MNHVTNLALQSLIAAIRDGSPEHDPDFVAAMRMTPRERLELGIRLSEEALRTSRYDLRTVAHRGDDFRL